MILVDANLLIYAFARSADYHTQARDWLDSRLAGTVRVGLPWTSLIAFLRVVTNPRIYERPASMREAWDQARAWLACEPAWTPQPTERHVEVLGELLALPGVRANLIHDADLAALAIDHGLILCSTDSDFARFPNLRWQNPLAA